MPATTSDDIYYRDGLRLPLATRAMIAARNDVLDRFMKAMAPTEPASVLDFGVSTAARDEANILEQHYPWPHRLTCAGVGPSAEFEQNYPGCRYVPITPKSPLPFADKSFDIAFSNAVLEHVGTDDDRRFVLKELLRVAHRIFIAVPNRWFPVEHHTGIPLLHYAPSVFRRAIRGTSLDHWSRPEHLSMIGRRDVLRFWPAETSPHIEHAGIGPGPLSSNIVIWT